MATYKVLQDIEAEDKLLGPLSLRQFIYAVIAIGAAFIAFKLATFKWFLAIPLLPPIALFGVLAAPFGHDQSSEVWLLAKIRFFLKPHLRIWDQSGMKELVKITAPKPIEKHFTNGLNEHEVNSRLQALANTLDSRGWAIKNVNVNLYSEPSYVNQQDSDRLLDLSNLPQDVPTLDIGAADDILDAQSNSTAHHFQEMITASAQAHRQKLVSKMQGKAAPDNNPAAYWFMEPSGVSSKTITPGSLASSATTLAPDDPQLSAKLKQQAKRDDGELANMHGLKSAPNPSATPVTTPVDPAILSLANNDDFNVATIARQASKRKQLPEDEVVVPLH